MKQFLLMYLYKIISRKLCCIQFLLECVVLELRTEVVGGRERLGGQWCKRWLLSHSGPKCGVRGGKNP